MTRQVWKYAVPVHSAPIQQRIPSTEAPLSVQMQDGQAVMWVPVDPTRAPITRTFVWYGTGWDIANYDALTFVGTVQVDWLAFHLFEVTG